MHNARLAAAASRRSSRRLPLSNLPDIDVEGLHILACANRKLDSQRRGMPPAWIEPKWNRRQGGHQVNGGLMPLHNSKIKPATNGSAVVRHVIALALFFVAALCMVGAFVLAWGRREYAASFLGAGVFLVISGSTIALGGNINQLQWLASHALWRRESSPGKLNRHKLKT